MQCPDCGSTVAIEQTPLGRWDGSCDSCGWFSGCTYETEEEAMKDLLSPALTDDNKSV